jgi:hypothetical protein
VASTAGRDGGGGRGREEDVDVRNEVVDVVEIQHRVITVTIIISIITRSVSWKTMLISIMAKIMTIT